MHPIAYYGDFVLIPLLIVLLVALAPFSAAAVPVGVAAWSLSEYLIHRYLFHRIPGFREPHDEHHAKPSGRTGVTSFQSGAIALVLVLALPTGFVIGLLIGYLAYVTLHHALHHWPIGPGSALYAAKMRHAMHHRGLEMNFGVTSTLWDRIFRTHAPWQRA